jgi:hypothetical protein
MNKQGEQMDDLVQIFYKAHADLHSARWGGPMDEVAECEQKLAELVEKYGSEPEQIALAKFNDYLRSL